MSQAGKYRTRVTIQQPTDVVGTIGDPQITWTKYADRWAAIDATNGREYQQAMTIVADLAAIVRLRYDTSTRDVTPRMRIVKGNRVWNIASATNSGEDNKEIVLYCTEVVQ